MGRKITIADVAKNTGLSISTVSKAFSQSTDISEITRAQILKCASDIGYVPKGAPKSGKIAVIVDGTDYLDKNNTDYQIFYGFHVTATENGFSIDVINKSDIVWDNVNSYSKVFNNYCGVFLTRIDVGGLEGFIKNAKIPIVSFGQVVESPSVTYVGCDYQAGLGMAIRHLKEFGHSKIAFFGGDPMSSLNQFKKSEFIMSLRVMGLQAHPEIIFESNNKINYASQFLSKLLSENATAVVCSTDLLASYMVAALHDAHISVPQQMSVIGFGDVPLSEQTEPSLTTISSNNIELGRCIFYSLFGRLKGLCVAKVFCSPKFVVRNSTAICAYNILNS